MAKKVLDEMPKEETEKVSKKVAKKDSCDKKCGVKKFVLPAIIVVAIAVVGFVGFLGYRMIFGDDPVEITTNAIRGLKDTIKDAKDDSNGIYGLISNGDAFEIKSKMNLSLPQGLGKYNLDMLLQADTKNEVGKLDLKADQNKKNILNLKAALSDSKLYFRLADTMKNYYFIDITEIMKELNDGLTNIQSSISPEFIELISKYDFNKLIDYAADSIEEVFTKDDFKKSNEEITVNGKEVKALKYTTKITQEKAIKIAKSFSKKAIKDEDLIKIIAEVTGEKVADVKAMFEKIINAELKNTQEGYILYSVYVSKLGKTLGYGFEIENVGKIVITEKNDVTTISITYGEYFGSIEINEKSDDHVIITGSLMGVVSIKLDIKTDSDTIKKDKEYKEKVDVKATVSAMGQNLDIILSLESNIKKINSVDVSEIKNAINIEKMNESQMAQFEREVSKSSFGSLIEAISKTSSGTRLY